MRTSISEKVSQRRPQPLRAGMLNKSRPNLIQTVHVSIMAELHFTVRVKRSGRLSEEGSAITMTARRPARCAVRDQYRAQPAKVKEETLDLAVVRTASSAIFWTGLLVTSERSAPTTVLAWSLTRTSQPHIFFLVVPTQQRIDGEAVSHRGGAKARGVHRALQGV